MTCFWLPHHLTWLRQTSCRRLVHHY